MNSGHGKRRATLRAGVALLVATSSLITACGNGGDEAPSGTQTTASSTPASSAPASPTEKGLNPTNGNMFTPTVKAPPPATMPPGQHRRGIYGIP